MSKELEKEKMGAIGARNKLKSASRSREQQHQQLHSLVVEKQLSLERLRLEYESLKKVEQEQQEFIDQLILQQ